MDVTGSIQNEVSSFRWNFPHLSDVRHIFLREYLIGLKVHEEYASNC